MRLRLLTTRSNSRKVMDRREAHVIYPTPTILKATNSRIAITSLEDQRAEPKVLQDKVFL